MPKKLLRNKRRRITKKNKKQLRKKRRKSRKRRNLKGGGIWDNLKNGVTKFFPGKKKEEDNKVPILKENSKNPLDKVNAIAENSLDKVNDKATKYFNFMTNSIKEVGKLAEKELQNASMKTKEQITGKKGSEATKESVKEVINLFKETTTTGVQEAFKRITEEAKQNNKCPCCKRKFDEEKPAGAEKPEEAEKPAGADKSVAEADKSVEEADKPAEKDDSLNLSINDFKKKD